MPVRAEDRRHTWRQEASSRDEMRDATAAENTVSPLLSGCCATRTAHQPALVLLSAGAESWARRSTRRCLSTPQAQHQEQVLAAQPIAAHRVGCGLLGSPSRIDRASSVTRRTCTGCQTAGIWAGTGEFHPTRREASIRRAGQFLLVGAVGVVVNALVLMVLYDWMALPLVAASVVATELAIVHNFVLNDRWTFRRRSLALGRMLRFQIVSAGGLVLGTTILWLLVTQLTVHYLVANLLSIGMATSWNYGANVLWTWGDRC